MREYVTADVLEAVDHEVPELGPAQVRVKTEGVGVNFADIMQQRWTYPGSPEAPFVPESEVPGVVDSVGADPPNSPRTTAWPDFR